MLVNSAAAFEAPPVRGDRRRAPRGHAGPQPGGPLPAAPASRRRCCARAAASSSTCSTWRRPQAWPGFAHYCASKAALHMLTGVLAVELAPAVRVCGVSPGTVQPPESYGDEARRAIVAKIPLGRAGSPTDVARAVRFLAAGPELGAVDSVCSRLFNLSNT
ncbi:MAG: SDR family oxidoreductase [Desulfomicrobium escambiense]|nr:SDR family oxidoreductase [Desulfomicrobium escambiense]